VLPRRPLKVVVGMVLCLRAARLRSATGCEESEVTEAQPVAGGEDRQAGGQAGRQAGGRARRAMRRW
jgi:hypothetical protein